MRALPRDINSFFFRGYRSSAGRSSGKSLWASVSFTAYFFHFVHTHTHTFRSSLFFLRSLVAYYRRARENSRLDTMSTKEKTGIELKEKKKKKIRGLSYFLRERANNVMMETLLLF